MRNTVLKWSIAILITVVAAYYQRTTGPTYELRGKFEVEGVTYKYELPRSHGGEGGQIVSLAIPDTSLHASLHYKRYKLNENWVILHMKREDGVLKAELPHQPPAGKLEYFITVSKNGKTLTIPHETTVVIRFRGEVPPWVLGPHILFMFISMLFANYAGIEAFFKGSKIRKYTLLTCIFLFIGGMIFGPLVQKLAFGSYWTGVPFGFDLTDNKTLIALIFWLLALWRISKSDHPNARWWVILAAVVMLIVFLIPHSIMGSELNYETMSVETGN